MDDLVLDELVDFFQTSDEFALSTAVTCDDLHQDDFYPDVESLLDPFMPTLLPLEPIPVDNAVTPVMPASANSERLTVQQQQRRSKDAARRSEYRKRQKEEKDSLRKEIDELSAKLDKLQDSTDAGRTSPSTDGALLNYLWKSIASRQKNHLENAEKEQQQLRAAISSRTTLIENMCGLLKKRLHDGSVANDEFGDTPRLKKRMLLTPTDSALFHTFIRELHTVYLQTDEVITACNSSMTKKFPAITRFKDKETEYYQEADRQTLPFKYKQICQSLWHWAQLKHRQEDREIYETMEDPGNIIAMKFRITSRRMGETVSLLQRTAARRFQEVNRVVVVWKVFSEGEGLFQGMHSDETGWCVVRPSTDSSMGGTILETCIRRVPMHFTSLMTYTPVINEFTDLVFATGDEENKSVLKALETMSLDAEGC
ncbi:unnamed protein product [Peronospora farinosa]|uniref:BZIP domain-containing protein n=1 Tax=Peronospora farinosa TaxID=134698 RepID=A0AAV0U8H5_9STRA|nr:unnamed protein product [Peronospora farinosa]CAI5733322.1 unnamed protein product [Peronospora farinosa]